MPVLLREKHGKRLRMIIGAWNRHKGYNFSGKKTAANNSG